MTLGYIQVAPTVSLPIIDCKSWRVIHGKADCREGHDLALCESCEFRVSRDGNMTDPPLLGRGSSPPRVTRSQTGSDQALPASSNPPRAKWRGVGDVIAAATNAVGIKSCGGCKARQAKLNALLPFSGSDPTPPVG